MRERTCLWARTGGDGTRSSGWHFIRSGPRGGTIWYYTSTAAFWVLFLFSTGAWWTGGSCEGIPLSTAGYGHPLARVASEAPNLSRPSRTATLTRQAISQMSSWQAVRGWRRPSSSLLHARFGRPIDWCGWRWLCTASLSPLEHVTQRSRKHARRWARRRSPAVDMGEALCTSHRSHRRLERRRWLPPKLVQVRALSPSSGVAVLIRACSSGRFATLSSLASSNAGPPRPPIAHDDDDDDVDDDDDKGPPGEGESWFAGGERRYVPTHRFRPTLRPLDQWYLCTKSECARKCARWKDGSRHSAACCRVGRMWW